MNLGRLIIFVVLLITGVLYFLSKPVEFNFFLSPWLHSSQLLALVGAVLLSVNFILSTRLKILDQLFGGLDKVYHLHHLIGALSFVLIINHPLFLVINSFPQINIVQKYLFLGNNLAYNAGILSVYSMVLVLLFTFIIRLSYQRWLSTHRLLGLPLILTLIHVLLINSDISRYFPLRLWILFWLFTALIAYIYKLFIYFLFEFRFNYFVSKINHLGNITEIYLSPQSRQLKFKPGQFVLVKFNLPNYSTETHPFTVSSSPLSTQLRLSIKSLGDFTSQLNKLKLNTSVNIIGPYGQFSTNFFKSQPIVCLAGGIGITPFLSMLSYESKRPLKRSIDLYYCVKNKQEAVYQNELQQYQKTLSNFQLHRFFSQDQGYLTVTKLQADLPRFSGSIYFLCGPPGFINSLKQNLLKAGIKSNNIIFEKFSFYDSN